MDLLRSARSVARRPCCGLGWLLLVFPLVAPAASRAESTVLRFARLVDGTGELIAGREILVEDGAIVAVGSGLRQRHPDATLIARDDLTAIPGLIDVHAHLTYGLEGPSHGDAWTELFATPPAKRLVAATRNARATVETGVTTVRDLFAFDGVEVYLSELIRSGAIVGPRMFVSGPAVHPLTLPPVPEGAKRDAVADLSAFARERVEAGADWLKIFLTTGSADDLTAEQQFFFPELEAATRIAHEGGLRVAVHAYGVAGVADALRAGVDSIEHPVGVGEELLAEWARTDVIYVPTIDHNRYYADHADEYGYGEEVVAALRAFVERNVETLRRAHRAGVVVAMGSDAVMTGFGENTRELEWFVEAGMTPTEALRAATVIGGRLLGQEGRLGRLQPGYAADVVGVRGDPREDVRAVTRGVEWVMAAGRVVVDRSVE